MPESQVSDIDLKCMILSMFGKALAELIHEFLETTGQITELEHKTFGKKKFANELIKRFLSIYDRLLVTHKRFEHNKEILHMEEEHANLISRLYADAEILALKNVNIIKSQIGEQVEETDEFAQSALNAYLEFEDLYRKFEKMHKELIHPDATKSEKMNKAEPKEDKKQDLVQLEPMDFADFAKYFNDKLFYCYIALGKRQEEFKQKILGKKKLAKELIDEYVQIGNLSEKTIPKVSAKITSVQNAKDFTDALVYAGYIVSLLSMVRTMSIVDADRLRMLYLNERPNQTKEFIQQAAKTYSDFKEMYPRFLELSKKYHIVLKEI